jgi:hypothetical protein
MAHRRPGLVDEREALAEDTPRPLLILAHGQIVAEWKPLENVPGDRRVDVREERRLEGELVAGGEPLDARLRPVQEVEEEALRRAGVLVRELTPVGTGDVRAGACG